MSQKADGNYGAGPPKLTLPITPRTLDGASSSSSGYQRGRDEEGSVDYLRESFDNDRVFGDSDEVRLEAYPTGERDSHRKRFDSFESWDSASSSCSSRDDDSNDEMELDENGLIFMSFEASHEFREMRATREVQHYGRVRVFKGPLGVVLYIGPHWYAIIVMVGVIIGIGFGFAWMLTPRLEVSENQRKVQGLVGTILTISSLFTFLRCALLSDPGLLRVHPQESYDEADDDFGEEQWLPSQRRIYCRKCKVMQRKGTLHCEYCQVCVDEFDHHCPWIGKCVGGGNSTEFYVFLVVSIVSFLYIAIVTGIYLGPFS